MRPGSDVQVGDALLIKGAAGQSASDVSVMEWEVSDSMRDAIHTVSSCTKHSTSFKRLPLG